MLTTYGIVCLNYRDKFIQIDLKSKVSSGRVFVKFRQNRTTHMNFVSLLKFCNFVSFSFCMSCLGVFSHTAQDEPKTNTRELKNPLCTKSNFHFVTKMWCELCTLQNFIMVKFISNESYFPDVSWEYSILKFSRL